MVLLIAPITILLCCVCCVYRVYVNRSISMEKIKYVGFDMDHTLAGMPETL